MAEVRVPDATPIRTAVVVHWLPLGAGDGSGCVRWNGRVYEALAARHERREPRDLYHSALEVHLDVDRYTVEMTPAWGNEQPERGVVTGGAVGLPWLRHLRLFRYEVRRWRDGVIPDLSSAVGGPQHLSTDLVRAQRLLSLVSQFPTATWGLDELHAGEMWNSNSLVSWLLVRSGHDVTQVRLPEHGRAPGWRAGVTVAGRETARARHLASV